MAIFRPRTPRGSQGRKEARKFDFYPQKVIDSHSQTFFSRIPCLSWHLNVTSRWRRRKFDGRWNQSFLSSCKKWTNRNRSLKRNGVLGTFCNFLRRAHFRRECGRGKNLGMKMKVGYLHTFFWQELYHYTSHLSSVTRNSPLFERNRHEIKPNWKINQLTP